MAGAGEVVVVEAWHVLAPVGLLAFSALGSTSGFQPWRLRIFFVFEKKIKIKSILKEIVF